tara:strand:+ start:2803 stop:2988 length:186 start_codon:yes stop_codon:yes gene_type:complete
MNAQIPGGVIAGCYDSTSVGRAANCYRLANKPRIVSLLYRGIKAIAITVYYFPLAAPSFHI